MFSLFLWSAWSLFCCTSNLGTLFLLLSQKHCPKFDVQQIGIQVSIIIILNFRFSLQHFPLWLFAQNTMENANQNQRTLQCYELSLKTVRIFFCLLLLPSLAHAHVYELTLLCSGSLYTSETWANLWFYENASASVIAWLARNQCRGWFSI